jgi:oxygen-dependent protoporphyrinogen oxidase
VIAIVGGGITGLQTGWELDARGIDFQVFESAPCPGGAIRSAVVEGHVLDRGPQRIRLTGKMARMVEAVGLEDEVVRATPGLDLFIYRSGKLRTVPFSMAGLLRSDIVGPASKLRLLLEPLTAGPDPEENVADFFQRKLGKPLYEALVAPLYGGLYASDPADMEVGTSLIHVLEEMGVSRSLLLPFLRRGGRVRPAPACTFRTGMQALPTAVAATLGERLKLDAPILALRRSGHGWRLTTEDGTVDAEQVVLTTPAPVAAKLLAEVSPQCAAAVTGLAYNPLAVVHLEAETNLEGFGFQVAFSEDLTLRGVTFNDSLFGRENLYTAYLGGARHPEVKEMPDQQLARLAVEEFRRCTGFDARPLSVAHEVMPAWDLSWRTLKGFALPEGLHVAANWRSRPGLPGRLADAARTAEEVARSCLPP